MSFVIKTKRSGRMTSSLRKNKTKNTKLKRNGINNSARLLSHNNKNNKRKRTNKLKIKAFAKQPKLSETFESETVEKLMLAVKDIHLRRLSGNYSFEELYKACQQLCTLKRGKLIFDKLYVICDAHICELIANSVSVVSFSAPTPTRTPTQTQTPTQNAPKTGAHSNSNSNSIHTNTDTNTDTNANNDSPNDTDIDIHANTDTKHTKHANTNIDTDIDIDMNNHNHKNGNKPKKQNLNQTQNISMRSMNNLNNLNNLNLNKNNSNISHGHLFLLPIQEMWDNHRQEMTAIRQIFLMLDRTYIRQTEFKSIWSMGICLLKKHLSPATIALIIQNVLLLIECERNGEEVDRHLLHSIIVLMAHLNIYKAQFEQALMRATQQFYATEATQFLNEMRVPMYLTHVIKRTKSEQNRVMQYLLSDMNTSRGIIHVIENEFIKLKVNEILDKGFVEIMDEQPLRINDLRHLYQLLQRVHELKPLQTHFMAYIKVRGTEIVCDAKRDKEMVRRLLLFKHKLDTTISQSFSRNREFRHVVRQAWEYFINQRQNKPAELMAKFVDFQLQTGARGTSEQELEETLDRVMDIFRFIHGKDVFQAFYKKDLAKRLLLNTSASEDAEKNMINRIRKECGQTYASNLEKMFKDVDISHELNEKFKQYLLNPQILVSLKTVKASAKANANHNHKNSSASAKKNIKESAKSLLAKITAKTTKAMDVDDDDDEHKEDEHSGKTTKKKKKNTLLELHRELIRKRNELRVRSHQHTLESEIEFEIQVLTSGCWPSYNTEPIVLPPMIQTELDLYCKFYMLLNDGRKIKWTSTLSHCILAANFPRGRKELVLSAFQATVLLLFNSMGNKISFVDIHLATKIPKNALKNTLLSLVKGNILMRKTTAMTKTKKMKSNSNTNTNVSVNANAKMDNNGDGARNLVLNMTTHEMSSMSMIVDEHEMFKLNKNFTSRLRRIKVNQIQIVETVAEQKKTSHKILKDRQYQIDACVVRIMKARKTLKHSQLMAECLKQLRFDGNIKQIKKRIQTLIENEYMERDANDNSLYHYKA